MKNKYKDGLGKGENHANLRRYYVELRIRIRVFFVGAGFESKISLKSLVIRFVSVNRIRKSGDIM